MGLVDFWKIEIDIYEIKKKLRQMRKKLDQMSSNNKQWCEDLKEEMKNRDRMLKIIKKMREEARIENSL